MQTQLEIRELGAVKECRPHGKITAKGLRKLLHYQKETCAITGEKLTPKTASVDHIIPLSAGGEHLMQNLQIVHSDVNRMKGTLGMDEFIQWCTRIAEFHYSSLDKRNAPGLSCPFDL